MNCCRNCFHRCDTECTEGFEVVEIKVNLDVNSCENWSERDEEEEEYTGPKVHAEIEYTNTNYVADSDPEGTKPYSMNIHSDICPANCNPDNLDEEHRKFLHDCLDEWFDNANGTGMFYIAEEGYQHKMFPVFDEFGNEMEIEESIIKGFK